MKTLRVLPPAERKRPVYVHLQRLGLFSRWAIKLYSGNGRLIWSERRFTAKGARERAMEIADHWQAALMEGPRVTSRRAPHPRPDVIPLFPEEIEGKR